MQDQYDRAAKLLNKDKCSVNVDGFESELTKFLSDYMEVDGTEIQIVRMETGVEMRINVHSKGFLRQGKAI